MRILAFDASLARCSATLAVDGETVSCRQIETRQGHAALLPDMARAVLDRGGLEASDLDAVAVTIGPGSFTGIRAGLALAHGIALAAGRPVIGVTVPEALAAAVALPADRALWVAIDSRRGRVFLARVGEIAGAELEHLPAPGGKVALAGDAASAVMARLAARGENVMLTDARQPEGRHIAAVAVRRMTGALAPIAAQPLYIDPPEARLPAAGLRPPPGL
jgi:tRNA threonylcarbamoyladenosine biosynthesis protein TsaB